MANLIEIQKDNILVSSVVLNYEKPDFVYIPIPSIPKFYIKKGDLVKIGDKILKDETTNEMYHATIAGKIVEIESFYSTFGKQDFIKIENDFTENECLKPKNKQILTNISKQDFLEKVDKKILDKLNGKKYFVLNCLDDEPFVFTQNFYLFCHYENYLSLIDHITKIYPFKRIIICVKSSSSENINQLISTLGMYPDIELQICPNLYLLAQDKFLLEYLALEEADSCVLTSQVIDELYNLLGRNRFLSTKLITISGYGVKNPSIIKVKIGTKLKDVIDNFIKLKNKDMLFFANGLMQGKIIDVNNFIITKECDSIIIVQKQKPKKEQRCINCGACLNVCPLNINPKLLSLKTYYEQVKDKCIHCNLCSYICPSYINFNKYLKGEANDELSS